MSPAPDESSPVHDDKKHRLGDRRPARQTATDHPAGETNLDKAEANQGWLRDASGHYRQVFDDAQLVRAAPRHLAPETVVEPDPGNGSRRKSPAELRWLSHGGLA